MDLKITFFATMNAKNRLAITKLKLSNHNLSIEKGRHQNVPLSDRSCPFCPEHLENELHFLIKGKINTKNSFLISERSYETVKVFKRKYIKILNIY